MSHTILFLHQNPFFRLLISLILGIVAARWLPGYYWVAVLFLLALCCWLMHRRAAHRALYGQRYWAGWAFFIAFTALGGALRYIELQSIPTILPYETHYKARITNTPVEKPRSIMLETCLQTDSDYRCKAVLYIAKDSNSLHLQENDYLALNTSLEWMDFAYYRDREFYYRGYVRKEDWHLENRAPLLRTRLTQLLRSYVNKETYGYLCALTLGDKANLSKEKKLSFSTAGVSHILAVSGMHIGIVYLAFSLMLGLGRKECKRAGIRHVVVLCGVWCYSYLCHFPASVVRASLMCSFVSAAKIINRNSSGCNALCFSAFCMLCYKPSYLYDIGFQLSYTAVASILFFYKRWKECLHPKHRLDSKLWDAVCVSGAAQWGTLPLTWYYFAVFPTYFLLSNLWVVPICTILVYIALAIFVLHFTWPTAALWVGKIANGAVFALEQGVDKICQLPYASVSLPLISPIQSIGLFLLIVNFHLIFKRQKAGIFVFLGSIVFVLSWSIANDLYKLFTNFAAY